MERLVKVLKRTRQSSFCILVFCVSALCRAGLFKKMKKILLNILDVLIAVLIFYIVLIIAVSI